MGTRDTAAERVEGANAITGGYDQSRYLYYQLKMSMMRATGIDLIVSFLMESGVRMIVDDLRDALRRGARVRILTGNYLGITQPSALYLIRAELGESVDLRFYNEKNRSFHPKSYIFHHADGTGEIYIGSSNVSRSALTSGIEWNYRFTSGEDAADFRHFCHTFEDLFQNHSIIIDDIELKKYAKNWHKPAVYRDLSRYDADNEITGDDSEAASKVTPIYRPRGAQIEALYALQDSRDEGAGRALVHAATGIGKTYLAAFDSRNYRRVLFVAHRQEILDQAAASFHNVRSESTIGYFTGDRKDTEQDLIFAMVESLGKPEYLTEHIPIIEKVPVDEFLKESGSKFQDDAKNVENDVIEKFALMSNPNTSLFTERMDEVAEIFNHVVALKIDSNHVSLIEG